MGYSISVEPRTKELFDKMLSFSQENFKSYSELFGDKYGHGGERGPLPGSELAYIDSPKQIGFDYSSSAGARQYVHTLTQWMAIRVGTQKDGVPIYNYDNCDWFKIEPEQFDEYGCRRKEWIKKTIMERSIMDQI